MYQFGWVHVLHNRRVHLRHGCTRDLGFVVRHKFHGAALEQLAVQGSSQRSVLRTVDQVVLQHTAFGIRQLLLGHTVFYQTRHFFRNSGLYLRQILGGVDGVQAQGAIRVIRVELQKRTRTVADALFLTQAVDQAALQTTTPQHAIGQAQGLCIRRVILGGQGHASNVESIGLVGRLKTQRRSFGKVVGVTHPGKLGFTLPVAQQGFQGLLGSLNIQVTHQRHLTDISTVKRLVEGFQVAQLDRFYRVNLFGKATGVTHIPLFVWIVMTTQFVLRNRVWLAALFFHASHPFVTELLKLSRWKARVTQNFA